MYLNALIRAKKGWNLSLQTILRGRPFDFCEGGLRVIFEKMENAKGNAMEMPREKISCTEKNVSDGL